MFIGDANDRATVLKEAQEDFLKGYFAASDDEESTNWHADFDMHFLAKELPAYWGLGQLTAGLVQVCDLVAPLDRDVYRTFISRLGRFAVTFLALRDDKRAFPELPGEPGFRPRDPFRDNRVMAAWGARTHNRDDSWNTDVDTSGLFAYAMAAFARRVALDSRLHGEFGDRAITLITAVIETFEAFRPELHLDEADPHAYFRFPAGYARLTCSNDADGCGSYRRRANKALPYNQNLSMMQVLAELARAADSALYRNSPDATPDRLRTATVEAPLVVAKNVAYFADHLRADSLDDGSPFFRWNYEAFEGETEDTAHGGFDLACLANILESQPALDAMLARAGRSERIRPPRFFAPIANTFLRKIWHSDNTLKGKVDGTGGDKSIECAGWVPLSKYDPWVWKRCRDTIARTDIRADNHAALLRYRGFGFMKFLTDFPGQNWLIVPAARAAGEPPAASIHDQKWLLVLTGVVFAEHKGDNSDRWNAMTVSIMPDMAGADDPGSTSGPLNWAIGHHAIPRPPGAPGAQYLVRFSVDEWSPSVTPNAVFNKDEAVDFGVAVDTWRPNHFGAGTDAVTGRPVGNLFTGINADVLARERKGWLLRLGYNITLTGRIVFVVAP